MTQFNEVWLRNVLAGRARTDADTLRQIRALQQAYRSHPLLEQLEGQGISEDKYVVLHLVMPTAGVRATVRT